MYFALSDFAGFQGYLYYTNEKQCQTLHSRIAGIWKSARAAANSRRRSALGKCCIFFSVSFITLLLILLMPPVCLLFSTLSIVFGLLTLPLIPILSLVFHFFCIILYDFYKPGMWLFTVQILIRRHFAYQNFIVWLGTQARGIYVKELEKFILVFQIFNESGTRLAPRVHLLTKSDRVI